MHIDLNAFFARAEEIRHPEYVGRPIVVGGLGSRGVVSTCSYEARKRGVRSGMPIFQARKNCPEALYLPVDFPYYEMLSRSFRGYLLRFSSLVEPASIDECYVDLSKPLSKEKDPMGYLERLRDGLYKELGLMSSIGIGPTKFLAKMGSDYKKPMGITIVRKKDIDSLLGPLPIESFFGIGKKTSARLRELGIKDIASLKESLERAEPSTLSCLGSFASSCLAHLRGQGDDVVRVEPEEAKSISRSHTFTDDTDNEETISRVFREMASELEVSLKEERKRARTVTVTLRDPSFETHSRSVSFEKGISTAREILEKGLAIFDESFAGRTARLVGLGVSSLYDPREEDVQMTFEDYQEYEELDKTRLFINEMNRKMKNGGKLMTAREASKDGNKKGR